MNRRHARRNPTQEQGMDTGTLLLGGVIGAVIGYMVKSSSEGTNPAHAAVPKPWQLSREIPGSPDFTDISGTDPRYTNQILAFQDFYTGQPANSPIVGNPCLIRIAGATIEDMRRSLSVYGRVQVLGISEFDGGGKQLLAWLVRSDGKLIIVGTSGSMDRTLTNVRNGISNPFIRFVRDYNCLVGSTLYDSPFVQSEGQGQAPRPMPRGYFSKAFRRQ